MERSPVEQVTRVASTTRVEQSVAYLEQRLVVLEEHMKRVAEAGLEGDTRELIETYLDAAEDVRGRLATDTDEESLPSLERVRRRFGLSSFEENTLLLVLAPLIDVRFSERIVGIKRSFARTAPDVGLALALFSPDLGARLSNRASFGPSGRLIQDNLIALEQGLRFSRSGSNNLLEVEIGLPARMQGLLLETEAVDPQLEGFSRLVWPRTSFEQVIVPEETSGQILELIEGYERFCERREAWGYESVGEGGDGVVMLFAGRPGTGKTLTAHALAARLGRPLLLVDATQLQGSRSTESNLDALLREARLQRAVLFFDDCELLFARRTEGNHELPLLLAAIDAYDGVTVLATNLPGALDEALDRRVTLRVDFKVPLPRLRERIWKLHLPKGAPVADDVDIRLLAESYEFSGGYIRNSVAVAMNRALARGDTDPQITHADFDGAARSQVRHKLNQLAVQSTTTLTLKDVVLPPELKEQIRQIICAVRNRRVIFDEWGFGEKLTTGKGLCVLFRGDSGTGKTLSSEIIASELAMPLYRVRIPRIISKYIGETEKNLEKCFREAALSGSLLLFDEADAIFSKRVEVSSSNDRYANMEVNMLLQEVERFDGVVILTTNLDAGIDDAFERRLNHKLDFPFPDDEARSRIWHHLIPDKAPAEDDIDWNLLGEEYELSGGEIKNAVIRAAYLAAERKVLLSTELLEEAAIQEYKELGKLPPNVRKAPWD